MKKRFINPSQLIPLFIALMLLVISCGTYRESRGKSIGGAYAPRKKEAPVEMEKKRYIEGAAGMRDYYKSSEYTSDKNTEETLKSEKAPERMVIHTAEYYINVQSVRNTIDAVNSMVNRFGGHLESAVTSDSFRSARIFIRVPVKKFEALLEEFEKMGEVTYKNVTALDVTMEYNDIALRVETAKKVRDRFYELLKKVKKVEERVKILKEIERLTQLIESLTTTLKSLGDRANFSTVILNLKAKVSDTVKNYIPSPFPWISGLNPDRKTIQKNADGMDFTTPSGFFMLEKQFYESKGRYLFISPGNNAGIRMGLADNYPPADMSFWDEALKIEMKNRMYRVVSEDEISNQYATKMKRYRFGMPGDRIYEVAFSVTAKGIVVIETIYETKESFERYKEPVSGYLKSLRTGK